MRQQRPMTRKTNGKPSKKKQQRNPPTMAVGWGRAGSQYRPGLFTKQYFVEYGEACCADVFRALKEDLRRINRERVEIGDRPIRGCTYNSYAKYWHWFKLLGLVEPTDKLELSIYGFLEKRKFYRLTDMGLSEVEAWRDPVRTSHPTS